MARCSVFVAAVAAGLAVALLSGCSGNGTSDTGTVITAGTGLTGKIIFHSTRKGVDDIYVLTLSPTISTKRVTTNPAIDRDPSWSPDGTQFVFTSYRSGNLQIWKANADGSGATRLTRSGKWDETPRWSPDGTRIAFSRRDPVSAFICTMAPDGSDAKRLTPADGWCVDPAWSPDSQRLAYAGQNPAKDNIDIYTMKASDGTDRVRLTNAPGPDNKPCYSPDGGRIVFASARMTQDSGSRGVDHTLWLMQSSGAGEILLTGNLYDDRACWSPDGQHIIFDSGTPTGQTELFSIRPNGTERVQVMNAAGYSAGPCWWQ